jgi:NADH-quinone oxidoreductase subunit M
MEYLLSILTFLPLAGAGLILFCKPNSDGGDNIKQAALWISLAVLGLSLFMLAKFDTTTATMQFIELTPWIKAFNINYYMGVDGISVLFIVLTALLTPICILVSWRSINTKISQYMASFLALECFVIGVFCALDFALFYVFWEAMLVPMFLIIGIWGGEKRIYASLKFFLYTFVGSVLMLVAMIYLYFLNGGSFDILQMANLEIAGPIQVWLFIALFAAFAVKVPMWPFHTWLPDAHVQAPTAGSVILAGILLKMGAYGFLRFSMPILPEATEMFAPYIYSLSVIAIIYAALVAFAQTDVKKMIAYSSVSHMGFVTLGIFAATQESVQGAILQMVNHGIVAAALFMVIGVIYDRMHTRELSRFGGIVNRMPVYAALFMLFTMASVGLPGTNSFIGEFLILLGSYSVAQTYTVIAAFGVVLGAMYMLWLYRKMMFGSKTSPEIRNLYDLSPREKLMFLPLAILVLWIGLAPNYVLNITEKSVARLIHNNTPTIMIGER